MLGARHGAGEMRNFKLEASTAVSPNAMPGPWANPYCPGQELGVLQGY